jgi:hypothetical protein
MCDPSDRTRIDGPVCKNCIGAGKPFDPNAISPEQRKAFEDGMVDAWQTYSSFKKNEIDTGKLTSADLTGSRETLKNNYLRRMGGTVVGIYGNSKEEAIYPLYFVDAEGNTPDGAKRYTLRFAKDQFPPVNSFWSVTMYEMPASLLVANPLNRYLINSPMLPDLKPDGDGGLTIYVQQESPGKDKESNWLPAPKGPFFMRCVSIGQSPKRWMAGGRPHHSRRRADIHVRSTRR